MKRIVKLLLMCTLIMGLAFTAIGCGQEADEPKDNEGTEKPKLIVGSQTTYAPFEFVDKETNEYVGFDMDLIRAIAEVQGYDVEIQSLGFDALIPALQAGTVDCTISAQSITPKRLEAIDFTEPYFNAGLIIAVQADNEDIKGLDDLKGKTLAAEVGTIGADTSYSIKEADDSTEVKIFDGIGEAFMELEQGNADAVVNDFPVTDYYIKTTGKGKIKMVGEVFAANDQYGIGVKKGNEEILNMLNEGLTKIKENGTYQDIYDKWFGPAQ